MTLAEKNLLEIITTTGIPAHHLRRWEIGFAENLVKTGQAKSVEILGQRWFKP